MTTSEHSHEPDIQEPDIVDLESRDEESTPRTDSAVPRESVLQHWFVMLASAAVIIGSFLLHRDGPEDVLLPVINQPLPDACTMRRTTGLDCPGCGMTRAFIEIAAGHWRAAWALNPGAFLMFPLFVSQVPWHAVQIIRIRSGRNRLQFPMTWLAAILFTTLVGQWIIKLVWAGLN